MNDCRKCYGVYRYFNYPKNEICFVVAADSKAADQLLESATPDAVSHWNFSEDGDKIVDYTIEEGLSEAKALDLARRCEEEYDEAPIGFPNCKVKPINQPNPADPAAGAGENTTQP